MTELVTKEMFVKRLTALRMQKDVSAREMSISLGQSPGYINNIENGINLPSMSMFFDICDYFDITPQEFFDSKTMSPARLNLLVELEKGLSDEQLNLLIALVKQFTKN